MADIKLEEQAAASATPAAGYWVWYALARGLEYKDDAGNVRRVGIAVSTANVGNPPADADLDTAFGAPADVGAGFIGVVDDNNADTDVWLCYTNGASWWYVALTKAV